MSRHPTKRFLSPSWNPPSLASSRKARCAPTKNMSGRRGDTDSPHHGGQAVARAAKIPHSTSPKQSPTTPVHKPERSTSSVPVADGKLNNRSAKLDRYNDRRREDALFTFSRSMPGPKAVAG